MELSIGMTKLAIRRLAQQLADAANDPSEFAEVEFTSEPNNSGPSLTIRINSEDMVVRDDIPDEAAYHEFYD